MHIVPSLATETPYLVLNSLDLLKASALPGAGGASGSGVGRKVAYPNVAITCVIKGEVIKVSWAFGVEAGRRSWSSALMFLVPYPLLDLIHLFLRLRHCAPACQTSLSLRLHSFALASVEAELNKSTSSGMTFDPKSHVITFTSDELDQCIAKFLG